MTTSRISPPEVYPAVRAAIFAEILRARCGTQHTYCELHNSRPNFAPFLSFSGTILQIALAQSVFNAKLGDYHAIRSMMCLNLRRFPLTYYRVIHVACDWFVQADVARLLLSSASAGVYHLPSPDPVQNLLINSVAGITPTDGAPLPTCCCRRCRCCRWEPPRAECVFSDVLSGGVCQWLRREHCLARISVEPTRHGRGAAVRRLVRAMATCIILAQREPSEVHSLQK